MKTIQLTKNKETVVDDDIFEYLNQYKWNAWYNTSNGQFYACRTKNYKKANGNWTSIQIRMHRIVLGIEDGDVHVDHVNGNTLDNRKENLRICNINQNSKNRTRKQKTNTSGYRGVYKGKNSTLKICKAQIQDKNGK